MAEYDFAQVQIRMIDLAWEWVSKRTPPVKGDRPDAIIEELAKYFDQAYKAITKTVAGK